MPQGARIVAEGFCPQEGTLQGACDNNAGLRFDIEEAKQSVQMGTTPEAALTEVIRFGSLRPRVEEQLTGCLSRIALNQCPSHPLQIK